MRPLVFISHSAKDREVADVDEADPVAVARRATLEYTRLVRAEIVTRLRALRYDEDDAQPRLDVWLDQETLAGGDTWADKVHDALHRCDGAVILLDPVSIQSDWVLHEMRVMRYRERYSPDSLLVVPVFLGAFDPALLRGNWSPIRPADLQATRLPSEELTPENAVRLAKLVVERFREKRLVRANDDSPRGQWVQSVGNLVERAPPSSQLRAAAKLGIDRDAWPVLSDGHIALADRMLSSKIADVAIPLHYLVDEMDAEPGRRLVGKVVPIWVDAKAGDELIRGLAPGAARVVILNLGRLTSAYDYLLRAGHGLTEWEVVEAITPTGTAEAEILRDVRDALRQADGLDDGEILVDDVLGDDGEPEALDDPRIVLLGPNAARADVAAALCKAYKQVRFLILVGRDPAIARTQLPDALLIEPLATAEGLAARLRRKLNHLISSKETRAA
jgi:hypothetical protein